MSSYLTAVWKRGGQRECGALTEAELLALVHEAMSTELREATSRRPEDAMLRIIGGASGDARCDEVLLHFLHASGDDPVKAERLFRQALQWRAEQQLERAPANIFMTSGVHMPVCACGDGLGSTGEVLTYTAAGLLAKPLDLQLLEKAIGVWFDRLLYTPQPEGYQASSVFAVVDFKGFSVSQVDIHALKLGILSYMRYYPGIFRRICLVNYPVAIYGIWKMIRPLLDTRTIEVVQFLKGPDALTDALTTFFEPKQVPDWLGGSLSLPDVTLVNGIKLDTNAIGSSLS